MSDKMKTVSRFLLALLLLCAQCPSASFAVPVGKCYLNEDFSIYGSSVPCLPDGWKTFGAGKAAVDSYAGSVPVTGENRLMRLSELFPDNEQPFVMLDLEGNGVFVPYCNTSTKEGGNVDEWLITPAINTSDASTALLLSFDVVLYGSNKPAPIAVYVASADADSPGDFEGGMVYSGSCKGSPKEVVRKRVYVSLSHDAVSRQNGIKLAFVCTAAGAQLVGFTNIRISEYEVTLDNKTPEFTLDKELADASLSVGLHFPEKCESMTCLLRSQLGESAFNCSIAGGDALDYNVDVLFKDVFNLDYTSDVSYDVVICPKADGAMQYTQSFRVVCREGFPSVCVMEEATGAWCPSCVRGIAAFERYEDLWGKRFIGFAIHNKDDMTVEDYDAAFREQSGISCFPSAWLNRSVVDDPIEEDAVKAILTANSPYRMVINKVVLNTATDEVTVSFDTECCYTMDKARLNVAFVVLQDGYKGLMQQNGYTGCTEQTVGTEWWPYFARFSSAAGTISPFVFDHVARGILPGLLGDPEVLPASFEQSCPVKSEYTFRMPELLGTGNNLWQNTSIVALLLDANSGKIVSADKVDGSEYITDDTHIVAGSAVVVPVSEYYTDLSGRLISCPVPGRCYLKTILYNDDSRRTVKQVFCQYCE